MRCIALAAFAALSLIAQSAYAQEDSRIQLKASNLAITKDRLDPTGCTMTVDYNDNGKVANIICSKPDQFDKGFVVGDDMVSNPETKDGKFVYHVSKKR